MNNIERNTQTADDFGIGDVVQLKSGGPQMVVYRTPGEFVDTNWMNASGHLQRGSFVAGTLLKVHPI